jgi:beta-lactamase regulating signal transducer with metallopeptidase domain
MHIAAMFTEFAVTGPAACAWFFSQWQAFAANAGSALISSIWQSAVILCALEIVLRLAPRISAAHRFALWAGGFGLAVAMPFLPLIHLSEGSTHTVASDSAFTSASSHAFLQIDARWGFVIAALWLIASLIRAFALVVHSLRLRQLWKAAQPVQIDVALSAAFTHFRHTRVEICTTRMLDRPSVIGFLSPRILIPHWLLSRLTEAELEQIVLHEAEHLHRGDDWTNLIQKLCLVVFPLNPALTWMENHLCREREMACDEGVIRVTNAPRAYAACLASLAERRLERRAEALSLGAWHRRSELVHRVHRILLHKRTMSSTAAGALLATLGSMLLAGSVEMSRFPQLVAFVPKHNTQAMTPARQVQSDAKLDALLARENANANLHLPPSFKVMPARAILPDQHAAGSAHTRKHASPKSAPEADPDNKAASISAQQVAKADQTGDRLISSQPQPQQWVVVATWREVTTFSRTPQTISDFATENEDAQIAAAPTAQNNAIPATAVNTASSASTKAPAAQSPTTQNRSAASTHQFTVTQLILRVVPVSPNSSSTQPPTPSVRDGWFVIQL